MGTKISYTGDMIKIMSLFEKVTRSNLKDSFVDNNDLLTFVVTEGSIGKAVGKKASNVKTLERLLNRKIKIVEFNSDMQRFINNLLFPLKIKEMEILDDNVVVIEAEDSKTRGIMIGRNAKNLRNVEDIAKKYFPQLKEIKIK